MKKRTQKLKLTTETLRTLDTENLQQVGGGSFTITTFDKQTDRYIVAPVPKPAP